MADEHQRYERLAVGHVVGGLDEVDAAAFRAHLLGCRDCRARVGELRDIASSLVATEREERATARAEVDVRTRVDGDADESDGAPSWQRWAWGAIAVAAGTVLLLGGLAWGVWVRAENELLTSVAQVQDEVLALLATGRDVEWTGADDVTGAVVTDGTRTAVNVTGVPALQQGEGVRVWLLDGPGAVVAASDPQQGSRIVDGRLTVLLAHRANAATLVVTVEQDALRASAPSGPELLRASLSVAPTPVRPEDDAAG